MMDEPTSGEGLHEATTGSGKSGSNLLGSSTVGCIPWQHKIC